LAADVLPFDYLFFKGFIGNLGFNLFDTLLSLGYLLLDFYDLVLSIGEFFLDHLIDFFEVCELFLKLSVAFFATRLKPLAIYLLLVLQFR